MSNSIRLFCLIYGEPFARAFSVKTNKDDTIDDLKELIIAKKPNYFQGIDADQLDLWKVEILVIAKDKAPQKPELDDEDTLSPTKKIGKLFPVEPAEDHVHVIIRVPFLRLNCIVSGHRMDNLIDVQLPANATVYALMDAFYNKSSITLNHDSFDYTPAYLLTPLSIEPRDTLFKRVLECESRELKPIDRISALPTCTSEGVQFILCVKPKVLRINCAVFGRGKDSLFEVQLKSDASLYTLKTQIATHLQTKAADFKLLKVSLPEQNYNSHLKHQGEELVNATDRISTIFTGCPPNHIHIIVVLRNHSSSIAREGVNALILRRMNYLKKQEALSTGGQPKNFAAVQKEGEYQCNRPRNAAYPIPITLFERIFAEFVDDCIGYQPTAEDNDFVLKLSEAMCTFYSDEGRRLEECRKLLAAYGVKLMTAKVGSTNFSTDGHVTDKTDQYVCAILEGKNEVGNGGAEPFLEGMCYYRQFTRTIKSGEHLNSRFPCFLLAVFGPYIAIFGCVFREHIHADILAPVIPLCWHATDYSMQEMAARIFGSFKATVQKLLRHYSHAIPHLDTTPTTVTCPYPRTYTDFDGHLQRFTYEVAQPETNRLVFYAQTEHGRRVCIKFTKRYSSEVHRLCVDYGCAPTC